MNLDDNRIAIIRDRYTKTHVAKGASISANATIVCGHDIGEYAFIGAGAVVTKTIPAYALVVGNPAKQIGSQLLLQFTFGLYINVLIYILVTHRQPNVLCHLL